MAKATKITPEKLTAFCAALAETGIVGRACEAVSICRQTAYSWRDDDPEFAAAWDKAKNIGRTALEDEAHRRAFEGLDKPIYQNGERVGAVREYSDTLAIFLLKAHFPEKYRERSHMELTGAGGGPVRFSDTERAAKLQSILANAAQRRAEAAKAEADDIANAVDLL